MDAPHRSCELRGRDPLVGQFPSDLVELGSVGRDPVWHGKRARIAGVLDEIVDQ